MILFGNSSQQLANTRLCVLHEHTKTTLHHSDVGNICKKSIYRSATDDDGGIKSQRNSTFSLNNEKKRPTKRTERFNVPNCTAIILILLELLEDDKRTYCRNISRMVVSNTRRYDMAAICLREMGTRSNSVCDRDATCIRTRIVHRSVYCVCVKSTVNRGCAMCLYGISTCDQR